MKAIVPVAGAGTRLRPLTYTQPKPLIPVAGKPIISFIVDQLQSIGVTEFIFIIGYLGEKIKNYVENTYPNLNATYVTQEERLGTAHAIWLAKEHFRNVDELVIFFGDVILDADFERMVNLERSSIAVKKVDDPRQFGIVEFDDQKKIRRFVEKPRIPRSDLAMVGLYIIREIDQLIEALDDLIGRNVRTAGEFPLTDALMHMHEQGVEFETIPVDNWFDCGRRDVLLQTNATFLDRSGYTTADLAPTDNSIIIHPVSIGKDCEITNSIIGPHVTISNNVRIKNAIVKNSIIGNYAAIREVILYSSVVGNDTSITGSRQSLNIGDNTEIDFSGG